MTSSESDESSSSHKPDAEDAELLARLKTQIEFYFSSENLSRDQYLKSLLWEEPAGAAPLAVIANFPKVRDILGSVESNASQTQTQSLIRQALHSSTQLTLSPDALWIVPNSPVPPNNAQTSNNWYQTHHVHQHQSMPVYPQVWHGPHPYAHPPHQHQHYPPAAQPYAPHYPQHAPVYSHHPVPHPHAMHPPQYHHSVYPAYYVTVPSSTSAPFHPNNTNIINNNNNNFGKGKNPKKDNSNNNNNNNNNTAKNNRKTKKNFETKEGAPMENYSHSKLKKNPASSSSSNYNFDKSSKPNHNKFTAKSKTRDKNNASSSSSSSSSSGITEEKHKNNDLKEADLSCTVAFPALGGGTSSTTNSNSNDAKNGWKVPPTSSGYAQALLRSNDTTTTATASQTSSLLSAVDVIEDVVVKSTGNTPSKVEKEKEENTGVVDQLEELHINGKNDGDGKDGVKRFEDEKHKSQEKSDKVLTTSTTASPSNAEASHEKSNGVDDKEVLPQEELHLKSNAEQQSSTMNTDTPTQQQPQQQQATTSTNHHQMAKEESSSKASSKENTIIFTEEENPPLPTQTLESCTKKVVAGGAWGNKPLFVDVIRKEA